MPNSSGAPDRISERPPRGGLSVVRPAWASTWRWKSSRERVIASEANRRASFREASVKEAGSEAAGRRTGIGYLIVTLAVLIGLVGTNIHFLSDTIAGAFVGASTGLMVAMLFARRASYRS